METARTVRSGNPPEMHYIVLLGAGERYVQLCSPRGVYVHDSERLSLQDAPFCVTCERMVAQVLAGQQGG